MPTKPIDYSNVSFDKLCCNDPSITDIYVGHTTNFTRRKNHHKHSCNTEHYTHDTHYNVYVYRFIRENGGWNNWSMIELCSKSCENKRDAERVERQYIENLCATLNKRIPIRTNEEWRELHKEELKEQSKNYKELNKEELIKKNKQYRELHKDEIKEKRKQYRELHKDEIKEKKRQYYQQKKLKEKEKV